MVYYFLLLCSSTILTLDVYVNATSHIAFKKNVQYLENRSGNGQQSNKVFRGLAMLHLFNKPIFNPFEFF